MKWKIWLPALLLLGCNDTQKPTIAVDEKEPQAETTAVEQPAPPVTLAPKQYANARFREVGVEKIGSTKFRVFGKAQIFEATFSWVVEDGHDELAKGFEMTDAGAPDWGRFDFTIDVAKKRAASTLHLILFETSAEDGSRQHELPIVLY